MSLTESNDIPAPIAHDVGPNDPHGVHAVPKYILIGVYAALLFLTIVTVGVSRIDLGKLNIGVALLVAVIKGGLVVMYFMHLRWDSPFNGIVVIAALLFVALFIWLAVLDTNAYQATVNAAPAFGP